MVDGSLVPSTLTTSVQSKISGTAAQSHLFGNLESPFWKDRIVMEFSFSARQIIIVQLRAKSATSRMRVSMLHLPITGDVLCPTNSSTPQMEDLRTPSLRFLKWTTSWLEKSQCQSSSLMVVRQIRRSLRSTPQSTKSTPLSSAPGIRRPTRSHLSDMSALTSPQA